MTPSTKTTSSRLSAPPLAGFDAVPSFRDLCRSEIESQSAVNDLLEGVRCYLRIIASRELTGPIVSQVEPSDIVQDTLLRVHVSMGDFRGDSARQFRAWLRRLLANQVVQACRHARAKRRDFARLVVLGDHGARGSLEQLHSAEPSPSKHLIAKEIEVQLTAATDSLSPSERVVFNLRNGEQLTFAAIGEHVGKSEEACGKIFHRALRKLRKALKGESILREGL